MGEPEMERDFGDFFTRDFADFAEDGGSGGGSGGGGMGGPAPFRGRGGGSPWRGGRGGGRGGHFDNGFGPRGPPPRFRGGRGGFMGPNMRGPGPRGPPGPGFRGGGHFERPFRPQGGWNNGPPSHHMGHAGAPDHTGPNNDSPQDIIWAEARTDTGTVYYYNTKTRVTSWERPEGAGIRIMSHEEWSASLAMKGTPPNSNETSRFGGPGPEHNTQSPGFQGQSPPSGQNAGFGPRPQSNTPSQNSPVMQGPPGQSPQVRPQMHLAPGTNPFGSPFRPPGTSGYSPGENGVPSSDEKQDSTAANPKVANVTPQRPAQQPPVGQQPPGFPPFGPMTTPPPFGMPFPQNFAMVPPPWNPLAGVPPPTGVPPPLIAPMDPIVQHIDPQVVARAFEWSEHMAPDGKAYYFNAKSQSSVWEKPAPLIDFETAKVIAQQRLMQQAIMNASKDKSGERHDSNMDSAKMRENEARRAAAMNEKCRPISSTPVSGTPWCVVWTGDKRVFFYNPSTKSSVWERPPELVGRLDVEELLKASPALKSIPLAAVKKAEATSTTEQTNSSSNLNAIAIVLPNIVSISNSASTNPNSISNINAPEKLEIARPDNKIIINIDKRNRDKDEFTIGDPPEKKAKKDSGSEGEGESKEVITIEDEDKVEEKKDPLKEANALEAEVKAARERATVPLETRLQQFKEMLIEKQVSAFSTWEKELHKIVFDSRYLLLTSKERKAAFDNYVRERALEERKERKTRLAQVKERFIKFLEDINVNQKMSYNEFTQKYSRDERYKAVGKTRDREMYFAEYIGDLKRREREAKSHKKDKVKEEFSMMLKDKIKDYHLKWLDVKKKLDDSRFDLLDPDEKEDLFRSYQKKLKVEMKYKERKKKKKMKKEKREKEKAEKSKLESKPDDKEIEEGESEAIDESLKSDGIESDNKMEDVSEEEEEEGVITDDSDDEDRARRERAEVSMREREKEVQRTLASHLRDRDKEREFYRHEEAVQEFQALLTDLVRSSEISWRDAKKNIKRDRRWEAVSILSREEMEDIFNLHSDNIARKKKLRFRDLLQEARVKLNSSWKDVRKRIRDDPRFQKYSSDERKCEREFSMYLKDLATTMKSDFRALLKETKMLTYKTKHHIRENPQIIKDIEALLEKDKRFLNLDSMSDERHRLLAEYLDELERKGPPPPPTASEPSRRLK